MLGQLGLHFFAVCDGHGMNGHHVSQMVKKQMPAMISKKLEEEKEYLNKEKYVEMYEKLPKQLD